MQTGNRISSPGTFFQKRVFPVLWFGFLVAGLIMVCFMEPKPGQSRTPFFVMLPGMAIFGYVLMRCVLSGLVDEVCDLGDTLLVKNDGVEIRIPLRNISHVSFRSSTNPKRITLELAVPCELGQKIAFIPTQKWRLFSNGAAITADLERRIGGN